MIFRTNIIAYNISLISNEIISVLNALRPTEDIGYAIRQCINNNKHLVGLDDYYINHSSKDWNISIDIDFYFNLFPERINIIFNNKGYYSEQFCYKAEITTPLLIISEPTPFTIDGLLYVSKYHHFLYLGQFTKKAPYAEVERVISISEIINGYRKGLLEQSKNNFITFFERISSDEKQNLKILNLNRDDSEYPDSENLYYIKEYLDKYDISCIVADNNEIITSIRKYLPEELIFYTHDMSIPLLKNKEMWLTRAVDKVQKYFSFVRDRSELPFCIFLLMREYHIPKRIMRDICLDIFDDRDVKEIEKHGYF